MHPGREPRDVRPAYTISLGILLIVAGALFALLYVGVFAIADCSAKCVAAGERTVVVALIAGGLAVCGVGIWLVVRGRRASKLAKRPA
jgi:hypothetical protein